jgi:DNA-binding response OmpR family regulator
MNDRKTVSITEDDPAILDALQIVFSRNGYKVLTYANGSALLQESIDKPDLFLIDRQLSGIDGLDICRQLKEDPNTSSIPVIIFSASPHVHNHAIAAGADDFIEKPFSNKAVLELVARHLNKS